MRDEPNEPLPQTDEPRFRFQILDLLVLMTAMACCLSAIRLIGPVAIALLPALLIAPSVLAHRNNHPAVKILFVASMVMLTIKFYLHAI